MTSAIEELHFKIEKARERLGISDYPCWYRGHARGEYKLVPSLFRRSVPCTSNEERNIYAEFVTESHRFLKGDHNSWEMISIMRHFGCPTRFMDWTDSLHAALFFAVLDEDACDNPCIWILNPYDLNFKATKRRMIFDQSDEIGHDYYKSISANSWPYELPIAMSPRWVTDRMVAQRGYFTFHGNDRRELNLSCKGAVKKISIDNSLVPEIRNELYRSRTDHRSIYPDLYGLGKYLSLKFGGRYRKR